MRKLLDLINEYSKVAEFKINIQKSIMSPHANSENSQRKLRKQFQFTIAQKIITFLRINLTKEVQNVYPETIND